MNTEYITDQMVVEVKIKENTQKKSENTQNSRKIKNQSLLLLFQALPSYNSRKMTVNDMCAYQDKNLPRQKNTKKIRKYNNTRKFSKVYDNTRKP